MASGETGLMTAAAPKENPPIEPANRMDTVEEALTTSNATENPQHVAPNYNRTFRHDLEINDPVMIVLPRAIVEQLNEPYRKWNDDMDEVHNFLKKITLINVIFRIGGSIYNTLLVSS